MAAETITAPTRALAPAPSAQHDGAQRAEEAAKEFEALVLAELLKPLFSSVETPGLAGGGAPGSEAFEALLQQHYAAAIAERGGFGIADNLKAALIEAQAASSAENPYKE